MVSAASFVLPRALSFLAPSRAASFAVAVGAETDEHIVCRVYAESLGYGYLRDGKPPEAVRTVAPLAREVQVQVGESLVPLVVAVAVIGAHAVLRRALPVVNAVYEVVLQEECQGAENA